MWWILFVIGGYFLIGFILAINLLRKTKTKTEASQKAIIILSAMVTWGYFFVKGFKRGIKSNGNKK